MNKKPLILLFDFLRKVLANDNGTRGTRDVLRENEKMGSGLLLAVSPLNDNWNSGDA